MTEQQTLYNAWFLIEQGRPEAAFEVLRKVEDDPFHLGNRAISLLLLHRLEEALSDYGRNYELTPHSDYAPIRAGIVSWWLGRPSDAVQVWQKALTATQTDAAGGVEAPALLYFAAVKLSDASLQKEALSLLKKRWKPRLAKVWPGPIAGYLLDKMDEQAFLVEQTFVQPILEARRLCKANFWVGLHALRQHEEQRYVHQLQEAIGDSLPEHRAVILESEYWLATAELELLRQCDDKPESPDKALG